MRGRVKVERIQRCAVRSLLSALEHDVLAHFRWRWVLHVQTVGSWLQGGEKKLEKLGHLTHVRPLGFSVHDARPHLLPG